MNKQTSIALHLARVMGKPNPVAHDYPDFVTCQTNPDAIKADERGTYGWEPHENISQWAECVLWAAGNGHTLTLQKDLVTADFGDAYANPADNTPSGIQAATLEAIARATSWEESK